jgi:hypothetical protein
MATIKKVKGSSFEEYLEALEIIKVLKSQEKPLTRLDMRKLGVKADRISLRQLEKASKITKEEHYLDNCGKTYLDKDKVPQKVSGTRYYIYSLVVEA